ncbi:uncharacterized protein LOC107627015 [Arachis ipaensis]|uniref:uncharacterized protein LOC107627015 n=1 Tax=Arachis ipaensis TaxID=130454 RepID=UPI0007AF45ED|nr:uncharacterized protein LOC107627015 [Arachis ipaensis]
MIPTFPFLKSVAAVMGEKDAEEKRTKREGAELRSEEEVSHAAASVQPVATAPSLSQPLPPELMPPICRMRSRRPCSSFPSESSSSRASRGRENDRQPGSTPRRLCGTSPSRPISRPSRRGLCCRRPNVAVRAPWSPSLFCRASPVLRSATPLPPSSLVLGWCFSWRLGGREAEPQSRGATMVCHRSARRLCRQRPSLESLPFCGCHKLRCRCRRSCCGHRNHHRSFCSLIQSLILSHGSSSGYCGSRLKLSPNRFGGRRCFGLAVPSSVQ